MCPIFKFQPRNTLKFTQVLGDKDCPRGNGVRSNQKVHRPDQSAGSFKNKANFPVGLGRLFVERQDLEGQKKFGKGRAILILAVAVFDPVPKLGSGDRGNRDRPDFLACEPPGHLGVPSIDQKNAVVGVEKVH